MVKAAFPRARSAGAHVETTADDCISMPLCIGRRKGLFRSRPKQVDAKILRPLMSASARAWSSAPGGFLGGSVHVLINALSARLGGGQTYLRNILLNIPQGDWRVFLLSPDNFDLAGVPDRVERIHVGIDLSNPYRRALWEHAHLGRLARRLDAQVLFSPGGLLPRCGLPRGIKTVVTFQNMLPYDRVQRSRYAWGARRLRMMLLERGLSHAMRRADLVIFLSHFAADFIQSAIGPLKGQSVIIPHGIDGRFVADPEQSLTRPDFLPPDDYYLYVSYIDFYKSQIEVVRAFAVLHECGAAPGKLLLVGGGHLPYRKALREEIARLELGSAVILTGNLPHALLPALYQHAQINIFASRVENCPNILMEIMASGRPSLVSCLGPMPELGGDTVRYFDPRDVESLKHGWTEILADLPSALAQARLARQRVMSNGWDKVARETWHAIAAA